MLIGCCHCDQPSESVPSIPSEPSEPSVSESVSQSISEPSESDSIPDIGVCGVCYNMPVAWQVVFPGDEMTMGLSSGYDPLYFNDCRSLYDGAFILQSVVVTDLTIRARVLLDIVDLSSVCYVWHSDDRAPFVSYEEGIEGPEPPCRLTTLPRWELVAQSFDANNPNGCSSVVFTLFLWWVQNTVFGTSGQVGFAWSWQVPGGIDENGKCGFKNCVQCYILEHVSIPWVITLPYVMVPTAFGSLDLPICPY